MTETESDQAVDALKQWFHSQGIMPGDAAVFMLQLMAEQLVLKDRTVSGLQDSANLMREMLLVEIAEALRR